MVLRLGLELALALALELELAELVAPAGLAELAELVLGVEQLVVATP